MYDNEKERNKSRMEVMYYTAISKNVKSVVCTIFACKLNIQSRRDGYLKGWNAILIVSKGVIVGVNWCQNPLKN